jgi:hypothetical protein
MIGAVVQYYYVFCEIPVGAFRAIPDGFPVAA